MFSLVPLKTSLIDIEKSSKDISLKSQEENSENLPDLCKVQFLPDPFKANLPILYSHRMEGDLLLYDYAQFNEKGEIRVSFDSLTGMTTVRTDNNDNIALTPFHLMVERLESQNDKNAYKLARKVSKMGEFVHESKLNCGFTGLGLRKSQRTDPRFRKYQNRNRDLIHQNFENLLIDFQFKFSKRSSNFEVSEISFNEKFREVLGFEDSTDFSKSLLKFGFPDAVFIEENYHNWYSRMVHNSFVRLQDPKSPKETMEVLIHGLKNPKECYDMDVEMVSVELEGYVEIMMHLILKPKAKKTMAIKKKKTINKENKCSMEEENKWEVNEGSMQIEDNPIEKKCELLEKTLNNSEFVKSFYPEALAKKRRVEPKECGYRLL